MAKKKIEIFIEVHNEKEFEQILFSNFDNIVCAEVYSKFVGSCTALDRLFTTIKLDWSDGKMVFLKVPADDIESLKRFHNQSEPVYLFIMNQKVTKVLRGVNSLKFAEVAKQELYYYKKQLEGVVFDRPMYEIDEPTPDEMDWMNARAAVKEQEIISSTARRVARQAARKRHRAELMVPHLRELNFVLFWPHCKHAHPELYERWDVNTLVRKILYEEIPQYDENKSLEDQLPAMTAFDFYKSYSPTKEEILQRKQEERMKQKEEIKENRARRLSEMQRLARQAIEEARERKRAEKEQHKLELLKAGNLSALEQLKMEPSEENISIVVPEQLSDEEVSDEEEIDIGYCPPPGLLIPGFYAPPNDIAKANALAILFPKLVHEHVTPQSEFLPPHVLVMLDINKRYKAIDVLKHHRNAVLHFGVFRCESPYKSVFTAHSVKQYDTIIDNDSKKSVDAKIAVMLSVESDLSLLELMDLGPCHVSRDVRAGEEECAAMFPVEYGDEFSEFEDFD
ncbi:uncharacterized protein LOC119191198 isoform X2 [Manduca sexta]|uniref:uncharacterized protein LOC119191198 isoform X2 n=1 Tax=Manduca sexta TaxID=7130 RepID=UPI00188FEBA7|nr:uncharacterized protein LOC119191198 isoform X2 [Manduca sexta]